MLCRDVQIQNSEFKCLSHSFLQGSKKNIMYAEFRGLSHNVLLSYSNIISELLRKVSEYVLQGCTNMEL